MYIQACNILLTLKRSDEIRHKNKYSASAVNLSDLNVATVAVNYVKKLQITLKKRRHAEEAATENPRNLDVSQATLYHIGTNASFLPYVLPTAKKWIYMCILFIY